MKLFLCVAGGRGLTDERLAHSAFHRVLLLSLYNDLRRLLLLLLVLGRRGGLVLLLIVRLKLLWRWPLLLRGRTPLRLRLRVGRGVALERRVVLLRRRGRGWLGLGTFAFDDDDVVGREEAGVGAAFDVASPPIGILDRFDDDHVPLFERQIIRGAANVCPLGTGTFLLGRCFGYLSRR